MELAASLGLLSHLSAVSYLLVWPRCYLEQRLQSHFRLQLQVPKASGILHSIAIVNGGYTKNYTRAVAKNVGCGARLPEWNYSS